MAPTNGGAQREVLRGCADYCVAEEENGRHNSANGHGISPAKEGDFAKAAGDQGAEAGAKVSDGIVAPSVDERRLAVGHAACDERAAGRMMLATLRVITKSCPLRKAQITPIS